MKYLRKFHTYFSPTAECYVVFAQYRFRCVLGELGRFLERFQVAMGFEEVVRGFHTFRQVPGFRKMVPGSMGSDRLWGPKVREPVPGTGSGFRWVRSCGLNTSKHDTILSRASISRIRGLIVEVGLWLNWTPKPTSLKRMFGYPQPFPISKDLVHHHPTDSQPFING